MTIKNYATLVLVVCACLASGMVVHAYGGLQHLSEPEVLLAIFGINLPFLILWAVAHNAKGTKVPRVAIAISIAFILLDAAVYFSSGSKPSDSDSIVFGAAASLEIILSFLMIVAAIVSCVRWESREFK